MNFMEWINHGFSTGGYLNIIKIAFLTFPFLAFLMTLPYMIHQYHKYGSIYYLRAGIFYSFVLYLLVAYFLVILPLPSVEVVRNLKTPRMQLIPFHFILDIIHDNPLVLGQTSTYFKALFHSSIYVVLYNILLTVPFGIYLRYYFKCGMKKTVLFSFLLSLFFEFTQLSGLYFIYPRGYRLFDVDDLMLNTLGGLLGYFLGKYVICILPNRDKIEENSYRLGLKISGTRRIMTYILDAICFTFFYVLTRNLLKNILICYFFYFILFPYVCKGQTLGDMFFHLKIVDYNEQTIKFFRLCTRRFLAIILYLLFPFAVLILLESHSIESNLVYTICFFSSGIIIIMLYFISFLRLMRRKPLIHEIITETKYISTIEVPTKKSKEIEEI